MFHDSTVDPTVRDHVGVLPDALHHHRHHHADVTARRRHRTSHLRVGAADYGAGVAAAAARCFPPAGFTVACSRRQTLAGVHARIVAQTQRVPRCALAALADSETAGADRHFITDCPGWTVNQGNTGASLPRHGHICAEEGEFSRRMRTVEIPRVLAVARPARRWTGRCARAEVLCHSSVAHVRIVAHLNVLALGACAQRGLSGTVRTVDTAFAVKRNL